MTQKQADEPSAPTATKSERIPQKPLSDARRAEIVSVACEFCGHLSEDELKEAVAKIADVVRPE